MIVHTVPEAAVILRCSNDSVYRLVKTGELRSFKVGKTGVRITGAALEAYVNGEVAQPANVTQLRSAS